MTEPGVYWNSAFAWLAGYAANDAQPPSLQISNAGGSVWLSWPNRSTPVTLQSTARLLPAATWTSVTNHPAFSNGLWQVPLAASAGQSFYRLSAQ